MQLSQLTGSPFSAPPATQNGVPVNINNWTRFTSRDQATTIMGLAQDAILAAFPGATFSIPLAVQDHTAQDGFVLNSRLNLDNPLPADIAAWVIQGNVNISPDGNALPTSFLVSEYAGLLQYREYFPDMAEGDSNYQQVGHGLGEVNMAVPGKLVATILVSEGLLDLHWVPA